MIRRAAAPDIDAIVPLWEALVAYHQTLDPALPGVARQGDQVYGQFLWGRLHDEQTCLLVAEADDGTPVGFALGYVMVLTAEMFTESVGGVIADIYVDPAHRRAGHGRALVDALLAWFRQQGLHAVEWEVAAGNTAGRAFWQAMGGRTLLLRMHLDLTPGQP